MTRPADVVIIGAGVTGASIAYQLGRRGVRRVLVVERRFVGAGATGKSSALIRMHYTNAPEARLAIASFPWFTQWADLVGGSCGYVRTGFVRLVTPDKIANLRANVAMLQRLGAKTRLITAAELGSSIPQSWPTISRSPLTSRSRGTRIRSEPPQHVPSPRDR